MICDGQAGVSCGECGHFEVVTTARLRDYLIELLTYVDGDPICPKCGIFVTFEDYLGEDL